MSYPSVAAMLLAILVALIAYLTTRRRGPFAWPLARLGCEALQSSAYIAHMLVIVAGGLVAFAVLCVGLWCHVVSHACANARFVGFREPIM